MCVGKEARWDASGVPSMGIWNSSSTGSVARQGAAALSQAVGNGSQGHSLTHSLTRPPPATYCDIVILVDTSMVQ